MKNFNIFGFTEKTDLPGGWGAGAVTKETIYRERLAKRGGTWTGCRFKVVSIRIRRLVFVFFRGVDSALDSGQKLTKGQPKFFYTNICLPHYQLWAILKGTVSLT